MPEQPIFVIAGDPGGARGILPVINAIRSPLVIFAYHQAAAILAENTHPNAHFITLPQCEPSQAAAQACLKKHAPLMVLGATSHNGVNWEKYFYQAARTLGIVSHAWVDFWTHYKERFTLKTPFDGRADVILVVDDEARQAMLDSGASASSVYVVGHPDFDKLREDMPASKPAVCADAKKRVLFVSQPLKHLQQEGLNNLDEGYDEHTVWEMLLGAVQSLEEAHGQSIEVHLRRHPRESAQAWASVLARHPSCVDASEEPIYKSLLACDLVVGIHTSLLIEAAILGKTVLSIQPSGAEADPLPTNRTGATTPVYEPAELSDVLKKALFDESFRQRQRQHQKEQFKTGCAVAKILEVLEKSASDARQ